MSSKKRQQATFKKREPSQKSASNGEIWLYGYHAATAALRNEERKILRLLVSKETLKELESERIALPVPAQIVPRAEFSRYLDEHAVHQGIAVLTKELPDTGIEDLDLSGNGVILILDQVTDPHNVGAVLRSAAAFDAKAVITAQKNAPEVTGVLAKSACGALETVPLIYVTNLARAMQYLKDNGYWCVALDGHAQKNMHETDLPEKCALVLGAEGSGLRRLTAENCDLTVKLPISSKMESLNVSNAGAVALYEFARQKEKKKIAK